MSSDTLPSAWLERFLKRMDATVEYRQRLFLFDAEITTLPPTEARFAFRCLLEKGWASKLSSERLALETAAAGVAGGAWRADHRRETFDAALAAQDRLVSLMIGSDFLYAQPPEEAELPVPAYQSDRPLTLGERKSIARKPDRRFIAQALRDPHPAVIQKLLLNPRLTENDVVFIAARRPVPPSVLVEIGCHPKWRVSGRTAFALISNPHTPLPIALSLLHNVGRAQAEQLCGTQSIFAPIRDALRDLLEL